MVNTKINVSDLKKFNQGSQGVNYSVTGLTAEQFNDIYIELCNMYNSVDHTSHAHISWYDSKVYGYITCKDLILT